MHSRDAAGSYVQQVLCGCPNTSPQPSHLDNTCREELAGHEAASSTTLYVSDMSSTRHALTLYTLALYRSTHHPRSPHFSSFSFWAGLFNLLRQVVFSVQPCLGCFALLQRSREEVQPVGLHVQP